MGLVNRVVPTGAALAAAAGAGRRARRASRRTCLRHDRLSAAGAGGAQRERGDPANELRHGLTSLQAGAADGAARFAAGEGRHGDF